MPDYKLRGHWVSLSHMYFCDIGTGADKDVTILYPQASEILDGWYAVGQKAGPVYGYNAPLPAQYLLLQPHPDYFGEPLAEYAFGQQSWTYVWGKEGSRGNFGLRQPNQVPNGYISLSDWFGFDSNPAFADGKAPKAVALDCLIPVPIGSQIWNDLGSRANDDGSMWRSEGDEQAQWSYFRAQRGYDQPGGTGYKLNMDLVQIV